MTNRGQAATNCRPQPTLGSLLVVSRRTRRDRPTSTPDRWCDRRRCSAAPWLRPKHRDIPGPGTEGGRDAAARQPLERFELEDGRCGLDVIERPAGTAITQPPVAGRNAIRTPVIGLDKAPPGLVPAIATICNHGTYAWGRGEAQFVPGDIWGRHDTSCSGQPTPCKAPRPPRLGYLATIDVESGGCPRGHT